MAIPNNFDFSDPGSASKSLKRIAQLMQRAGQPVVSQSFFPKIKRSSGVSYREAMLTLASGQTVTLRVTQTGDIFQILLNNSVRPIHQQSDPNKAVAEIAKMADSNQAAFQKAQARVKVELPKGIKTAAPRMEVALQSRSTELDAQIAERQGQVNDLKTELGETALDAVTAANLSSFALAELKAFPVNGTAIEDGDVLSKQGRDELFAAKLIERDDGANWLNEAGKKLAGELGEAALDAVGSGFPCLEPDGNYYDRDQYDMVPTDEHGEMPPALVLKAGAVPVRPVMDGVTDPLPKVDYVALEAAAHEQRMTEALALASSVLAGTVLDSVGMAHALASLRVALEVVETNYPINIEAGNIEQAQLEAECAESFRNAIAALDSAANQDVGDNPPKLDEPQIPQPSHAADPAVAADAKLQYPPEPVTDAVPEKEEVEAPQD